MDFHRELNDKLESRLAQILTPPGLFPVWCPSVRVSKRGVDGVDVTLTDNTVVEIPPDIADSVGDLSLAEHSVETWPPELRMLFKLGAVYLRDQVSEISPSVSFDVVRRLVVRQSVISHFSVLRDGAIAIVNSHVGPHSYIVGPAVLIRSTLHVHNYAGRNVLIEDSFLASYAKAQCGVSISRSLVAAYCGMDGGTHPEQYPLSSNGFVPQGVEVGAHSWIGHHTALLAGARVGIGTVVASGVVLAKPTSDHIMLLGNPPRVIPLDYHLRGLSREQAFAAGVNQGTPAAVLPMYGPCSAQFTTPNCLVIDYVDHAVIKKTAEERLVDFHRGALTRFFGEVRPDLTVSIVSELHSCVRFTVNFDRDVEPTYCLTEDTVIRAKYIDSPDLASDDLALFRYLTRGPIRFGDLMRLADIDHEDFEFVGEPELSEAILRLSQRGYLEGVVVRWRHGTMAREKPIFSALANPLRISTR